MRTILAATTLAVALGMGAAVASPASAQPPRVEAGSPAPGSGPGAVERVWFLGRGDCVWGVIPILGHHVIVLEPCEDVEESLN